MEIEKAKIIKNGNTKIDNVVLEDKKPLFPSMGEISILKNLLNIDDKTKEEIEPELLVLAEEFQKWYSDQNNKEAADKFLKRIQSAWLLKQNTTRFEVVITILNKELKKEEENLLFWNNIVLNSKDELEKRQAAGNIPSTEHRIAELKKAIEILPVPKKWGG